MRKIIALFVLMVGSFTTQAQSKIGTIDADYILAQMPEMTEIDKGLETYGKELQDDLQNSVTSYETQIKSYQDSLDTLTEEEKTTMESEIISLENEIKGYRQKASVLMQMKRNELTQPLYEKINTAMLSVVQAEGFTQVLHAGSNALAFSAEDYDITFKVMEKLGLSAEPATK